MTSGNRAPDVREVSKPGSSVSSAAAGGTGASVHTFTEADVDLTDVLSDPGTERCFEIDDIDARGAFIANVIEKTANLGSHLLMSHRVGGGSRALIAIHAIFLVAEVHVGILSQKFESAEERVTSVALGHRGVELIEASDQLTVLGVNL